MINITIEKAKENDSIKLNELFSKLLEDDRLHYDENIKENLTMNSFFEKRINLENNIILVAKNDDNIIGYIYGYIRNDNKIKKELEANIESLYIEEIYRNNKVGTRLINEFINIATLKNVKYIFIENKYSNKIASSLYNKLGFNNFIETKRKEI